MQGIYVYVIYVYKLYMYICYIGMHVIHTNILGIISLYTSVYKHHLLTAGTSTQEMNTETGHDIIWYLKLQDNSSEDWIISIRMVLNFSSKTWTRLELSKALQD